MSGRNFKVIWDCLKEVCPQRKNVILNEALEEDNSVITKEWKISNAFVNYHTEVGVNLAAQVPNCTGDDNTCERGMINSLYLEETDYDEIIRVIRQLKDHKSPGYDYIRAEVIKIIVHYIVEPLTHVSNLSFRSGVFPETFKEGVTIPLHKDGDKLTLSNYRMITLTTVFSKIYEKVLKKRIIGFLEKYETLSGNQFGFREKRSTQDAMVCSTTEIHKALDNGKPSLAIFIDLKNAFDTVDHNELLQCLKDIGFRGIL